LWSGLALFAGAILAAGSAYAQSASGSLSSYRYGYGAGLSGLESPVNLSLVSSASQFTLSDGVNEAGAVGSVFAAQTSSSQTSTSQASGGAGQSYSGVGQGATSNARAPLAVVENAKPDGSTAKSSTLAATSSANAAAATATTANAPNEIVLNGQLNLDGGQ